MYYLIFSKSLNDIVNLALTIYIILHYTILFVMHFSAIYYARRVLYNKLPIVSDLSQFSTNLDMVGAENKNKTDANNNNIKDISNDNSTNTTSVALESTLVTNNNNNNNCSTLLTNTLGHNYPGVSIIKPVMGVDTNLKMNLNSFFKMNYPHYELLFCVPTKDDESLTIIKQLIDKYPNIDCQLLIGLANVGVNPKINNMHKGFQVAKYPLVLISDSGILMRNDTLTDMVNCMMQQKNVGLVHQVPFMHSLPVRDQGSLSSEIDNSTNSNQTNGDEEDDDDDDNSSSNSHLNDSCNNINTSNNPNISVSSKFIKDNYCCCCNNNKKTCGSLDPKESNNMTTLINGTNTNSSPSNNTGDNVPIESGIGTKIKRKVSTTLVHQKPLRFAHLYQLVYFGAWHAKIYLNAAFFGINCTTGMSCLIRKCVMDSAPGGLGYFGCYLAEDYFMAQYFQSKGWRCIVSRQPAWQNSASESVSQFQARIMRWYHLRARMVPHTVLLEPLSETVLPGLIAGYSLTVLLPQIVNPAVFFLCHLLVFFLLDYLLLVSMHPPQQRRQLCLNKAEFLAVWLFREFTSLFLQLRALFWRSVEWRTHRFHVKFGGITEEMEFNVGSKSSPVSTSFDVEKNLMGNTNSGSSNDDDFYQKVQYVNCNQNYIYHTYSNRAQPISPSLPKSSTLYNQQLSSVSQLPRLTNSQSTNALLLASSSRGSPTSMSSPQSKYNYQQQQQQQHYNNNNSNNNNNSHLTSMKQFKNNSVIKDTDVLSNKTFNQLSLVDSNYCKPVSLTRDYFT